MIVYQITNLVNGKRYIGMTCQSLAQRWMEHRNTAQKGSRTALHSAIRKYGADSFVASILVSLPAESERAALCDAEKLMIQREGTLAPVGYNLTPGGDGLPKGALNPNVGKKASLAHVEKLKLSWTPERREAMRKRRVAYNIQKNQTDEHKSLLRAAGDKKRAFKAAIGIRRQVRNAAQRTENALRYLANYNAQWSAV